ncbi:MAG: hypothetical protein U1E11_05800 [Dethiobacteria bacterium]|nr:hypothetical protein [Dethiobacteria bacterium]
MKIHLQGIGFIKNRIEETELEVDPGTLLDQLPALLGLPVQQNLIYIVNGNPKKADAIINDGDHICLISRLSGG